MNHELQRGMDGCHPARATKQHVEGIFNSESMRLWQDDPKSGEDRGQKPPEPEGGYPKLVEILSAASRIPLINIRPAW